MSTRRIAERAGCSETLLFRYFGDKRGLLMAICNTLRDDEHHEEAAPESQDVREFTEHFLISELHALKRQASSLKVVVRGASQRPRNDHRFRTEAQRSGGPGGKWAAKISGDRGSCGERRCISMADAIEQLGFTLGFLLQLVFERPEAELVAIAKSSAAVLSLGLQAEAAQPMVEPRRRKAMATVLDARNQLDGIIAVLEDSELKNGIKGQNGSRAAARSRK